jgi:hypothetical protein
MKLGTFEKILQGLTVMVLFVMFVTYLIKFFDLKTNVKSFSSFKFDDKEYVCKLTDKQIGINMYLEKIKELEKTK